MSTDLISSVTKLITPDLLARVASALGIDPVVIEKALSAGIPGLLAAFISMVSKPGGAARLADAVAQQQPGALANMGSAGPAARSEMIDSSVKGLSTLLGGGTVSALTSALGRYAGLGDTGAKSLMGLLGPLVMNGLGQEQRAKGLDAAGLAQLLQSQKGSIAQALPSGFARLLGDSGILDQVSSVAAKSRMRDIGSERSQWSWVAPALAIVALGALAWYLFGRTPEQTVATAPPAGQTMAHAPVLIVTADEEKNWVGRPVFSADNEKVGEIIEIKRGPDNRVTDVFFDGGTFLGMGARRYHITGEQIAEVKPNGLVVALKEADVKALPPSEGAAPQPDMAPQSGMAPQSAPPN